MAAAARHPIPLKWTREVVCQLIADVEHYVEAWVAANPTAPAPGSSRFALGKPTSHVKLSRRETGHEGRRRRGSSLCFRSLRLAEQAVDAGAADAHLARYGADALRPQSCHSGSIDRVLWHSAFVDAFGLGDRVSNLYPWAEPQPAR
jgi:hypothetical protein